MSLQVSDNAVGFNQRIRPFVNEIFMGFPNDFLIAFIDDLLIYSESEIEHYIQHYTDISEGVKALERR